MDTFNILLLFMCYLFMMYFLEIIVDIYLIVFTNDDPLIKAFALLSIINTFSHHFFAKNNTSIINDSIQWTIINYRYGLFTSILATWFFMKSIILLYDVIKPSLPLPKPSLERYPHGVQSSSP